MLNLDDEFYMKEALNEARLAAFEEEVPVGCVIVKDKKIIGRGHNYTVKGNSALYHSEIIAIKKACEYINDFRLTGATLYVTKEPCTMCAGAIVNSRIDRVVIALSDPKRGACGSHINVVEDKDQLHWLDVEMGLLEKESLEIIQRFFKKLRKRQKDAKKNK
ncbi:MAG: nucleoside deaminase [Tissierellia bacterium]|nr:nucleoside deaminase [Tissierellia bacterium]